MQKSLENYLEAADGAGSILAHARLLNKLANLYRSLAPAHLYEASTLANYKSGIIVVHAATGAVAAKLRQLAPTLAAGFSRKGIECSGVQVKVQAPKTGTHSSTSTQKPLSPRASGELEDLRNSLPAGDLRAALDEFLSRVARAE